MKCRICSSIKFRTFVDLGLSPLSNSYLTKEDLPKPEPKYPLHAYVCETCLLVQLPEHERAERIFSSSYAYFSSYSTAWLEHCKRYAEAMTSRFHLGPNSLVVEAASNDGYLLQFFIDRGIPSLGVEPTANTAEVAKSKGIPTEVCFFNAATAQRLASMGKKADLMAANNVLAHVPDIHDFVEGFRVLLKPKGCATFEFPYLKNLIEQNQFDTIYHEHFSYLSLRIVERLFAEHGLEIFDSEELETHGGSLRVYVKHKGQVEHAVSDRYTDLRKRESAAGYDKIEAYLGFEPKVRKVKMDLVEFLEKQKSQGHRIVGYGAPAKGNTLLNYCDIETRLLPYTVDLNVHKQGLFLPGSHIPILSPDRIRDDKPDGVLILPWNLQKEIVRQLSFVRDWGGRFYVPIPRLTEV